MTDEDIFLAYKNAGTFKTLYKQKVKYFNDPEFSEVELEAKIFDESTYKTSVTLLKKYLTKEGITRYREQFKRFKYNLVSSFVTMKLRKPTHDKIMALSSDFEGVDDFIFEYLFDPLYVVDNDKIANIPSPLTNKEKFKLLFKAVGYDGEVILKEALNDAYKAGFILGQSTKKIRSKKGVDEAIIELDYDIDQ